MADIIVPQTDPASDHVAGSFDDNPASTTLPMVGAIPPLDTRDRSDGGPLDRMAWVYEFSRRHDLTKPERAVLHYMAFRAAPQRLFQCDDSEDQIGEWTGYERHSVNRAIKGLIRKGAVYQTRSGKGGHPDASRYRLRGTETWWRVADSPEQLESYSQPPNGNPEFHCSPPNGTRSSIAMEPGVQTNGTRSSIPPGYPTRYYTRRISG